MAAAYVEAAARSFSVGPLAPASNTRGSSKACESMGASCGATLLSPEHAAAKEGDEAIAIRADPGSVHARAVSKVCA